MKTSKCKGAGWQTERFRTHDSSIIQSRKRKTKIYPAKFCSGVYHENYLEVGQFMHKMNTFKKVHSPTTWRNFTPKTNFIWNTSLNILISFSNKKKNQPERHATIIKNILPLFEEPHLY